MRRGLAGVAWAGLAAFACNDPCVSVGERPSLAVECSPGQLCYRGQCVPGCSPGQELLDPCESNLDCENPRPNCVDGFCSACTPSTSCVPGLSVCRPIASFERPEVPPEPEDGSEVPPGPLDGPLPRGVERFPEIEDTPVDREVTRVLRMVFQRRIELDPSGEETASNEVEVAAWDVSGTGAGLQWYADARTARISALDEVDGEELRGSQCEVRALAAADVDPVDLGRVGFEDGESVEEPESIRTPYEARFEPLALQAYVALPRAPIVPELFVPSVPGAAQQGQLLTTGVGRAGVTVGGFAVESHVPFGLVPTSSTAFNLARGYVTSSSSERPFVLGWRDPVVSGVVVGESVFVEIIDQNRSTRIRCEEAEGPNGQPQIIVPAAFLRRFAQRAGPGRHTLRFGRKNERVAPLRPGPEQVIDASVRIALSYASPLLVR